MLGRSTGSSTESSTFTSAGDGRLRYAGSLERAVGETLSLGRRPPADGARLRAGPSRCARSGRTRWAALQVGDEPTAELNGLPAG